MCRGRKPNHHHLTQCEEKWVIVTLVCESVRGVWISESVWYNVSRYDSLCVRTVNLWNLVKICKMSQKDSQNYISVWAIMMSVTQWDLVSRSNSQKFILFQCESALQVWTSAKSEWFSVSKSDSQNLISVWVSIACVNQWDSVSQSNSPWFSE